MEPNIFDGCGVCSSFCRVFNCCPVNPGYYDQNMNSFSGEMIYEYIMMFLSAYPYFLGAYFIYKGLFGKSLRQFFMMCMIASAFMFSDFIVKRIARIIRPEGACSQSYGFPSSHSVFGLSLFTWLLLEDLLIGQDNAKLTPMQNRIRIFMYLCNPLIPFSRVYLNYHSIIQVTAGSIIGVVFAFLWFNFLIKYMQNPNNYQKFDIQIVDRFNLRNYYLIENGDITSNRQQYQNNNKSNDGEGDNEGSNLINSKNNPANIRDSMLYQLKNSIIYNKNKLKRPKNEE